MKKLIPLLAALFVGISAHLNSVAAPVQSGVARIDITPPLEMKASLGGYGERMNQPATGTYYVEVADQGRTVTLPAAFQTIVPTISSAAGNVFLLAGLLGVSGLVAGCRRRARKPH